MVSPVPVILLFAMASCVLGGTTDEEAVEAIAKSNEKFAASVYEDIEGKKTGNLVMCPLCVQNILALVQAGARSQTSEQIGSALDLPEDKAKTQLGFKQVMLSQHNEKNKVTLKIANKVYIADEFQIDAAFNQIATDKFHAGTENLDFSRSVQAAKTINEWVEEKTNKQIKDLISKDDLEVTTRMVLVNALYFNGRWKNTFDTRETKKGDFFLNAKDTVQVDMMYQTDSFNYAVNTDLDCKFLELPYEGDEFVMTIILPNKKDGLPALENRMAKVLAAQQYQNEPVEVMMPKFKVEETIHFKEILERLGMLIPFTDEADFGDITTNHESLKINKVIQKNFINVHEEGTESASAPDVKETGARAFDDHAPPPKIYIDHPFLYTLRYKKSGIILYQGRITNPSTE